MCDIVSAIVGIGAAFLGSKASQAPQQAAAVVAAPPTVAPALQPDPAVQRAAAETDATNKANEQTADQARTRRANVLATGGSSDALGQVQSKTQSNGMKTVLGGGGIG